MHLRRSATFLPNNRNELLKRKKLYLHFVENDKLNHTFNRCLFFFKRNVFFFLPTRILYMTATEILLVKKGLRVMYLRNLGANISTNHVSI